ncbi:sugar transferase [Paenibacillus lycopersici]|uniref:Sugar transferase n=2 Tax=Paenibacillus lycopersici TaxID=2704462 RepID=A0A6C0FY75_9BACL|nr:sugar transferase [Paenibacillus lycopersici]
MKEQFMNETSASLEFVLPSVIQKKSYYLLFKRLSEVVLSCIIFALLIPIIAISVVAILVESPGPVFYVQERVGWKGQLFKVIKLRSMRVDAEKNGAQWAMVNDPRVTRVGSFIRKTRIDELPQLINVIKGDMSLIGPRPERPIFVAQFNEQVPGFIQRLLVKPGLSGWAQVNGGYDISVKEKLDLDMYYIQNMSFALDMKILLKTIKVVFTGEGAR